MPRGLVTVREGSGRARMALRVGGRFHWPADCGGSRVLQATSMPQTLISAAAVRVGRLGLPAGKPGRALVLRSRCRLRSTVTRRLPRLARVRPRFAVVSEAGRLAVAAPAWTEAMTARRAAVKEISRGWTGCLAQRPRRA